MSEPITYPGVYTREIPSGSRAITGVPTSIAAFVGRALTGPPTEPATIFSFSDYQRLYGGLNPGYPMSYAVRDFFLNGGTQAIIVRLTNNGNGPIASAYTGGQNARQGLHQLDSCDIFNVLCVPPDDPSQPDGGVPQAVYQAAATYCHNRRAMFIADPPAAWSDHAAKGDFNQIQPADLGITGEPARNTAVYFPRVYQRDPDSDQEVLRSACGIIAGIWAATDQSRGVWKAPAGMEAALAGITRLETNLTDEQQDILNPLGINCLRTFPVIGSVIWGARTLAGADILNDDYKYIPVRRLTLFIEESLYRGTKWAVFEPNGESLWSQLRLSIDTFMAGLSRQGAFYNYSVRCDASTTTQDDIDRGIVNVVIAFAPVNPAEFILLQISQEAGQCPA